MLVTRAKSRIDSETLYQSLSSMHQRALRDKAYYYTACKTSRQIKEQDPLDVEFKKAERREDQPT
jgi:hypothetical protein